MEKTALGKRLWNPAEDPATNVAQAFCTN